MLKVDSDIRSITATVQSWCDEVYPERTKEDMIKKLMQEFQELSDKPLDGWEMADIAIIMFDLANHLGFDLPKLIHHKMEINRKRSWKIEEGVLQHVKNQ
jgi:phage pi2 protein 07